MIGDGQGPRPLPGVNSTLFGNLRPSREMKVFYSPNYYADIGAGHVFPIRKFELVRDRLLQEGTLKREELVEPAPASIADVLEVHTAEYVTRLLRGEVEHSGNQKAGTSLVRITRAKIVLCSWGNDCRRTRSVGNRGWFQSRRRHPPFLSRSRRGVLRAERCRGRNSHLTAPGLD